MWDLVFGDLRGKATQEKYRQLYKDAAIDLKWPSDLEFDGPHHGDTDTRAHGGPTVTGARAVGIIIVYPWRLGILCRCSNCRLGVVEAWPRSK